MIGPVEDSVVEMKIYELTRVINSLLERVAILEKDNKRIYEKLSQPKYIKLKICDSEDDDCD